MLNRSMNHKEMNNAVKGFLESLEGHGVNDYTTLKSILNKLKKEIYYSDKYNESRERHFEHYRQVEKAKIENKIKGTLISKGQEDLIEEAIELYNNKDFLFLGINNFFEQLKDIKYKQAESKTDELIQQLDRIVQEIKSLDVINGVSSPLYELSINRYDEVDNLPF